MTPEQVKEFLSRPADPAKPSAADVHRSLDYLRLCLVDDGAGTAALQTVRQALHNAWVPKAPEPDREIVRLDGIIAELRNELTKLHLQLFQAFYAGAVWCDQNGLPLSANPEPYMEPGFTEWLEKAKLAEVKDLSCVIVENGGPYQVFDECVHIGKKELEQLQSRAWVDRITALLALPKTAIGDDIAKAVEICVRRCEALELRYLANRSD
jgi:hypothetical protein